MSYLIYQLLSKITLTFESQHDIKYKVWNTNKLVGNSDQIFQIIFQTWTCCSKFPYSYTWVALWQIPTRLWQDWQTSERGQDHEPWTRGRVTASHPTSALATRRRCRPSTCPRWGSCCSARWRPASCPTPGRRSPATGNNHCCCFPSGTTYNRSRSFPFFTVSCGRGTHRFASVVVLTSNVMWLQ